MSHDEPEFAGVQSLEDLDAGRRIPIGYPPISIVMVGYDQSRREEVRSVASLVSSLNTGEPSFAAVLLADARAIYSHSRSAGAADHQRAVVLAAIASEVGIKQRLRELASENQMALLDVILNNPREVTQSPPQLLNKTCLAVAGVSLSNEDDVFFKDVERRLFTLRNKVVHGGLLPSEEQARRAVEIATRLSEWLAQLRPLDH